MAKNTKTNSSPDLFSVENVEKVIREGENAKESVSLDEVFATQPSSLAHAEPPPCVKNEGGVLTTAESLEMEEKKTAGQILLFRRGAFMRAYNDSARLVNCVFRADFKLMRDKGMKAQRYVYLGFPVDKQDEIFEGCDMEKHERHTVVNVSHDRMSGIPSYEKWLSLVKVIDRKETELPQEANIPISSVMHVSNAQEVALRLATYHMESHTMMENMQFLSEVISSIRYR